MKKSKIFIGVLVALLLLMGTFLYTNEAENILIPSPMVYEKAIETPVPVFEETEKVTEEKQSETPMETAFPVPLPQSEETEPFCTLTVTCEDVLGNMESLAEGKEKIIPSSGIILPKTKVTFKEGENAFDVLLRVLKEHAIHMEYSTSPIYNSVYIEGIGNLYEFDCGDTSGWTYSVNGESPMYGCSQHTVKQGDNIEFRYKCSLY